MDKVGEIFLSAFIQVLFQQLASSAMMALARMEKVESHFNKLSQDFRIILAVLEDAEERQLEENSVRVWLEILKDLAYDLDDILDEVTTRYLIQEAKGIEYRRTSRVWKFIPSCHSFAPDTLVANYKMMSKIKDITNRLQIVVKQKHDLTLRVNSGRSHSCSSVTRLPTTSLVDETQVYGRDEDKDTILKLLLKDESGHDNISVIPIVGMGGIGKTTLAQLVYNDGDVNRNFHVKAWVCVSEEFDVLTITKTILQAVSDVHNEMELDLLQVNLKDKLSKSKFLIVLDDVWNESYAKWELLSRPFQFGLPGSKIIVTTRTDTVALVVGSPRAAYHMKLLTDEDCLALLAQRSRRSLSENPDLKEVGLGLARRCKGLPLAAKTLGGLLLAKETVEDWDDILKSKIWDLPGESSILPVLRLSYYHLPLHLKHLFVYCSIFPKDYEFNKNELVLLWMGEGFLEIPNERKTKEELGHEYFNELLYRSFFQRSSCESLFVMHDLINDLAHFVAGGTCYRLDEKIDTNLEYRLPGRVRHASFLRHEYEVFKKFKAFSDVRGLRTFLPMPVQNSLVWPPFYLSRRIIMELVPKLHSLRVLSLSGYAITELPSAICSLTRLRYLNLSGTSIVTLPHSLSDLYCLETLSLSNCRYICNLPPTIGNLKNLRHLDVSDTDKLKDMPVEIGNLEKLQTLPKVVLNKTGGLGLKELKNLKNLQGKLAIMELQNVTDIAHVREVNLSSKNKLSEVELVWGSNTDDSIDRSSEEEVLDLLRPHKNLKRFKIEFYGGTSFPGWIGNRLFCKLSSVILRNCTECTSLPPLGLLPKLKELYIREMPKIKCIGAEFYGCGALDSFPKLEILRFNDMPEWEKWSNGDNSTKIWFPKLHQLAILDCQKLTNVSPLSFPVLHELDLENCSNAVLEMFCDLDRLTYFKMGSITGISHIPTELVKSLSTVEVLECCSCDELLSLWPSDIQVNVLTRLRRLVIADCPQLVSVGEEDEQLPCNLEVLEIFKCASLTSLPNDLSSLDSLRELIIKNCLRFITFPENGIPPLLKRLEILTCHALESLPSNIHNLERLEIKECSSLRAWGTAHFPADLKKLAIKSCNELDSVSDSMFPVDFTVSLEELNLNEWINYKNLLQRLRGFSNLVELSLSTCAGLRHFPESGLPPHLRALSIDDCKSLKSLPSRMRSVASLMSLEIRSCPRLENFPQFDFPPNLSSLRIWDSKRFKPLSEWGLHRLTSLREFSVCGGFREIKVLGDDCIFPPSLTKFSIARFQELNSLSKVLDNLTLLRHLSIMNCPKLHDLPSDKLLENLWDLKISDCAVLSPKCVKERGEYWSKISGIPCVEINDEHAY